MLGRSHAGSDMTSRPSKPPKGAGFISRWLVEGKPTALVKGGRGRFGAPLRFLEQAADEIRQAREERGLTWDDIAQAAASAGLTRVDGSPYPGGTLSKAWGRVKKRSERSGKADAPSPHQPRQLQQPNASREPQELPRPAPQEPVPTPEPAPRSLATPSGLPPGFEDLLNPRVTDPKKPNPPKLKL